MQITCQHTSGRITVNGHSATLAGDASAIAEIESKIGAAIDDCNRVQWLIDNMEPGDSLSLYVRSGNAGHGGDCSMDHQVDVKSFPLAT